MHVRMTGCVTSSYGSTAVQIHLVLYPWQILDYTQYVVLPGTGGQSGVRKAV